MIKYIKALALTASIASAFNVQGQENNMLRVATFNVSMEALNYVKDRSEPVNSNKLDLVLKAHNQQIKHIAEIIQTINPDIILLNEFDRTSDDSAALLLFLNDYLAKGQNGQKAITFPHYYQGSSNTGVVSPVDFNNDGKKAGSPSDTYGFGLFPGHYAMAILSKYPIDHKNLRTFQRFKWKDMPRALKPINPDNSDYYNEEAWDIFRLSSKSFWDVPVNINGETIHVLASHPTPPVFDGPEDRNGKRNHDEIRLIKDYISTSQDSYIYDDKGQYGGLGKNKRFVILGDLNASISDGDAIVEGIQSLVEHPLVNDPTPTSLGGKENRSDNANSSSHTASWGIRADYVLPSEFGFTIKDSGVFWPAKSDDNYRLVVDRAASSDHRLVWVDLAITQTK